MKKNDFPSEEERELVRKYVIERPLVRPNITYLKALVIVLSAICTILLLSMIVYFVLQVLGIQLKKEIYFLSFFIVSFALCLRWFAILLVKLYQRYAKETVRRRCLLKPTCSEYAIIVFKKYGFLIGGIKVWIRLNYKCCGNVYYIDEP